MTRATFILVLILLLGAACNGYAVPLETVSEPAVNGNGSPAVSSGVPSFAPPAQAAPHAVASSSVPAEDPLVGAAGGGAVPKIPKFPVEMFVRTGTTSHFELFFLNVKYGYDLEDFQFYMAWCLCKGAPLPGGSVHDVRLYNSSDPNMPSRFKFMQWHKINYIINHRTGANKRDVQEAIWQMACSPGRRQMSARAVRLVQEANLKGKDFTPGPGQVVAVICQSVGNQQPIFIEVKVPSRKPAAVKAAIFPAPMSLVGGAASRLFIPPIFWWPSGGSSSSVTPTPVPEPSGLLLLSIALVACILVSHKMGKRPQGRS